jgi:hypothetical protein
MRALEAKEQLRDLYLGWVKILKLTSDITGCKGVECTRVGQDNFAVAVVSEHSYEALNS